MHWEEKNGLLLFFVNASLEIFWTNTHNNYIMIQSSESKREREREKRWVRGVRALYFDLRISLWKNRSWAIEQQNTPTKIYPHYRHSTLQPPSKRSKANSIWTASLTSTRFVSMAVLHSYTRKEKGLQIMWHPNPGLSLRSIRAFVQEEGASKNNPTRLLWTVNSLWHEQVTWSPLGLLADVPHFIMLLKPHSPHWRIGQSLDGSIGSWFWGEDVGIDTFGVGELTAVSGIGA